MSQQDDQRIFCSAGCKKFFKFDENGNAAPGWELLQISQRWRCGECYRDLKDSRTLPGTESRFEADPLPKDSIGNLKKMPTPIELHERVKP